jgi:LacI family transcriptional regulator
MSHVTGVAYMKSHDSSQQGRTPTIFDVAELAGTSKSTVSNVIRNAEGVALETQERVHQAIERLGYRPNVLARQLAQQKTTILGVVAGDLANPFHAEMTKQIQRFASTNGFQTMAVDGREDGLRGVESLIDYRAAGILFLSYSGATDRVRRLVEGRVPAVFIGCSANWGDVIVVDDLRGGEAATKHLIALGHKEIAHFIDPETVDTADIKREMGYRQAMEQAQLPATILHWDRSSTKLVRNQRIMSPESIFYGPKRVTAIFASNDVSAIRVLDCADRLGLSVPYDLSVVGFDDVMFAALARINLTTIAQPQDRLAQLSVAILADRIRGGLVGAPICKIVEAHLVVRNSTTELRG